MRIRGLGQGAADDVGGGVDRRTDREVDQSVRVLLRALTERDDGIPRIVGEIADAHGASAYSP